MHCPRCNAEVDAQTKFCPECGAALAAGAAAATSETPTVPMPAAAPGIGRPAGNNVEDERELWQGSYSGKAMVGVWVFLALASLAALVAAVLLPLPEAVLGLSAVTWVVLVLAILWLYAAAVLLVRRASVHYRVTTQRLIHRHGIVSVTTDRIELIDVDDISFRQGIVERMFNVGTIVVTSSDRTHPKLELKGIDQVGKVADTIDDARRQERRRRGLHIETI